MSSPDSTPVTDELIPAATVVLGRDGDDGPEVLMLRRNSKIAFGGAWVFPGGRVDPDDGGNDELERARTAAVRESQEETGLVIQPHDLGIWSYWAPPASEAMVVKGKRRRFSTWFFIGQAPDADVAVDMGEIHEHRWLRPSDALALHQEGEIELIPPTWVTLFQLGTFDSIDSALAHTVNREPDLFVTRPIVGKPLMLTWDGDIAYDDTSRKDEQGPRNRLVMADRNWVYERS